MKPSVNQLGWTGAIAPVATPLLDSAIWLKDTNVLSINYNDTIEPYFNGDLGLNENTAGDSVNDVRDGNDIEVSPRELSKTFLIPHGLYRQLEQRGLLKEYFDNMARAFLETHLLFGHAYDEAQLKESPIYGVLTACAEDASSTNITEMVETALAVTPNIGDLLAQYDTAFANKSIPVNQYDVDAQPWGDMPTRLAKYFDQLPLNYVVRENSMALVGSKVPQTYTKFLVDKNLYEVAITWLVAGVPVNSKVGVKSKAPTKTALNAFIKKGQ